MVKTYKTEGIVIKRRNFGEADRLVTLFTKSYGKIVALAKGVRKINSKKAPHLELFTHCRVVLSCGRNLDIISESYTLSLFKSLREDFLRLKTGFTILEVLEKLLPERQVHKDIFTLCLMAFKELDTLKEINLEKLEKEFFHELLWRLGYLPSGKVFSTEILWSLLEKITEKRINAKILLTKSRFFLK